MNWENESALQQQQQQQQQAQQAQQQQQQAQQQQQTQQQQSQSQQQAQPTPTDSPGQSSPQFVSTDGFNVFATSACSEYLAAHMLNGVETIDISDFSERFDDDAFANALFEAVYQNPLIVGINGFDISWNKKTISVRYDQSLSDQQRKQKEIQNEVRNIAGMIIKPGMSDIDKELAINSYLCETSEYDTGALENATDNDFQFVDPTFFDSFTPYGILINKSGVCAGYAGAFKLLADEAGLQSIVITGYLYGYLPHAWNKVLIDGEWMTVDTTNNNNDALPNVLLNIPDNIAKTVLVEDNRCISSISASLYKGEYEDLEYYRMEDKYYPMGKITDKLVEELAAAGHATLRTDYELTDKQFFSIVQDVIEKGGFDINSFDGNHWLGTIYLTLTDR
jgi:hypothetical protein